ncbi:hypothetical protein [Roseateles koreensis]|uniref:Lipoprotein n=1 Tax=Roseateles koreensis TaxID=2987526 RepID=A0ABT5KRP4_9BURK|nr:hypothetical protein [Roseateles koreensis]MDC8785589.1 hypothetical protein [Roseateles koreensis]
MNGKRNWTALLSALVLASLLSACGGGSGSGSGSGGGDTSGGSASGSGSAGGTSTTFSYTRYDVYGLYSATLNSNSGPVASISASKGVLSGGNSFAFRGALAGGDTTITLGTGSVSLSSPILTASDLSWLAPGADGQLIQQCAVVRMDATGAATTAYPKSMLVMVANTATALTRLSSIPAGTDLYAAEDCKFTGSAPTSDIAAVTAASNDRVTVNGDGTLSAMPVGSAAFMVSAANVSAALAAGGTGLDSSSGVPVPSTAGLANGSYAMHAYSLPRAGTAPRYVVIIQATPTGGSAPVGSRGVASMWVSK